MTDEKQPSGKPSIARLKTGSFERNFALARLGVGAGAKIAVHSLSNIFRGEVSKSEADRDFYSIQAKVLADELGQLKGSVMKAGQMLAMFGDYFMPHEAVEVLSQLQDDTPPVAWKQVAPQLRASVGAAALSELDIDETPMAAASLGQAHRARRKRDGLELVVKIQYPGVADAINSDIKTLSRLLYASRLTPKNIDLAPTFAEVREMLQGECDYVQEAAFTEDFAKRLAGDSRYVVPRVLREYSGARVLTTTYERGVSVSDASVKALSQKRRDALGMNFVELFLTEFFRWGLVQTDPHFGNYRVRLNEQGQDQLVLLDFGATRAFPRRFINDYAQIVFGALEQDQVCIRKGAEAIGLIGADFPPAAMQAFAAMCERIVEPFDPQRAPDALRTSAGNYRFSASDLPMRVSQIAARNALTLSFRLPPREVVFLHRRLGGVYIALATLAAELNLRKPLDAALADAAAQQK
ncbi:MAG: AarF/ABC1/UbiB kinase family protein [Stagnimonas sp.]|nr:AarF/ABC1/UbiB kinase family protein [Stagnimonas sp.]